MTIGEDVTLGINDYAGAKRMFFDCPAVAARGSEEAVEEIIKRVLAVLPSLAPLIFVVRIATPADMGVLFNRGFGIDVYHAGFELLCDLGKLIGEDLRRRDG